MECVVIPTWLLPAIIVTVGVIFAYRIIAEFVYWRAVIRWRRMVSIEHLPLDWFERYAARMTLPAPGTIGLSRIHGVKGFFVMLGQALAGDASLWTHAFMVVGTGDALGVIQAQPGGAVYAPLSRYLDTAVFLHGWHTLTPEQVTQLQRVTPRYLHTPYSFLDYLSLALVACGIRPAWLRRYVASTKHMICSQLVDQLMSDVGVHLFNDGRLPQDVTPGDLLIQYVRDMSARGLS